MSGFRGGELRCRRTSTTHVSIDNVGKDILRNETKPCLEGGRSASVHTKRFQEGFITRTIDVALMAVFVCAARRTPCGSGTLPPRRGRPRCVSCTCVVYCFIFYCFYRINTQTHFTYESQ